MSELKPCPLCGEIVELNKIKSPVSELIGTKPLVLYFSNDKDRDEFIEIFKEAVPNAVSRKID